MYTQHVIPSFLVILIFLSNGGEDVFTLLFKTLFRGGSKAPPQIKIKKHSPTPNVKLPLSSGLAFLVVLMEVELCSAVKKRS